jgi:ATP-binding cassette subfamily B protein
MRETLRGIRLMLAISWRADAVRSVAAAFTASGQFVVLPIRAFGLKIVTDGIVGHDRGRAIAGVIVIVTASAANRLLAWASLNVRMRLREHTQLYLDSHLMGLTAGLPGIEHHELPEYLDAVERLRMERPYLANPFNPISWSTASILQGLTVVVLFAGVSPILALLPLLGLPAAIATGRAENRSIALADRFAEDGRVLRHLFALATEPGPAKEVRVYGLGDELLNRRAELFDGVEAQRSRLGAGNVIRVAACWLLFAGGYAAALSWTVHAARIGEVTVGSVVLVLTLGAQLNAQLAEMAFNVAWFARSLRAVRRLVWFTDYAETAQARYALPNPAEPPDLVRVGIRLDHVGFAYPGSDRRVLSDIDLFLPAGSTVAVVGENGSGKTTLVKLLARMYEPTDGRILLDGVDVRSFRIDEWRRRLSAGFQDFVRFELPVRESVGAGDVHSQMSDQRLVEALDHAVASDVLADLPDHLDTQLGRQFGGVELSIGQWQKVALGRAMLRDAPLLLILDEPTASLDAPTEHALFERFAGAAHDRTDG